MTMKIEFEKKVFLQAVSKAAKFTETNKSFVHVIIKDNQAIFKGADTKLNQLDVSAYDLSVEDAICKVEGEGTIVITPKLENLIKTLPNEQGELLLDNNQVTVKQGKMNADVSLPNEIIELNVPSGEMHEPLALPKSVLSILADATLFAISTSDSRPALKGIHINATEEKFEVVGTDSHRLGRFLLNQQLKFPKVTIPGLAVKEILNLYDDDTKILLTPIGTNFISFEAEGQIVYVRLLNETYPDTSRLVNNADIENAHKYKVNANEILNVLKFVNNISSDNERNVIIIKPSESGLEFMANSEKGNVSTEVAAQVDTHFEGSIAVTYKYFKEAIVSHKRDEVVLHITSGLKPLFVMSDNTYITQLVLPVRIA